MSAVYSRDNVTVDFWNFQVSRSMTRSPDRKSWKFYPFIHPSSSDGWRPENLLLLRYISARLVLSTAFEYSCPFLLWFCRFYIKRNPRKLFLLQSSRVFGCSSSIYSTSRTSYIVYILDTKAKERVSLFARLLSFVFAIFLLFLFFFGGGSWRLFVFIDFYSIYPAVLYRMCSQSNAQRI